MSEEDMGRRGFLAGGGALLAIGLTIGARAMRSASRANRSSGGSGGGSGPTRADSERERAERTAALRSMRDYRPTPDNPDIQVVGDPKLTLGSTGIDSFSQTVTIDAEGHVLDFQVHGGAPGNLPGTLRRMRFEGGPATFELVWAIRD